MNILKIIVRFTLGGLYLIALPAVALAVEAAATTDLNVRTGPGTSFGVVDTLHVGEVVETSDCQANGWCYVTHDGPDGWVSSTYLETVPTAGGSGSDCQLKLTFGPTGPKLEIVCGDGSVSVGGGGGGGAPAPTGDEVCFYTNANYSGQSFCYAPGSMNSLSGAFNDKITSIDLNGNAKAVICDWGNLKGYCRLVLNDVPQLGSYINDKTSSLQVYTGSPDVPPGDRACFYWNANYNGSFFCEEVGKVNQIMPAFDNKVSSLMLFGGAKAKLCSNANLGGDCFNFTTNTSNLPPSINNQATSLEVYKMLVLIPLIPNLAIIIPPTHSDGALEVPSSYNFDLDAGVVVGGPLADLWYHNIGGGVRYLEAKNGAQHARGDGTLRNYPGCLNETYSSAPLPFAALSVGTYVCVKTSEGRISQFRVNGYDGLTLKIGYTTWGN